jgi:hypothetical protein
MRVKILDQSICLLGEGNEVLKILKPKEVLVLIKDLQRSLFDYKNLTGKKIDEPQCY